MTSGAPQGTRLLSSGRPTPGDFRRRQPGRGLVEGPPARGVRPSAYVQGRSQQIAAAVGALGGVGYLDEVIDSGR